MPTHRTISSKKTDQEKIQSHFIQAYDFAIRCIDREDSLVNHRLTWALFLNVALLAFMYNMMSLELSPRQNLVAFCFLCTFGIIFTFASYCGVWAARKQTKYIKRHLTHLANEIDEPFFKLDTESDIELSNFRKKSAINSNIIESKTGFLRPFGYEGYFIREAGQWVPDFYALGMVVLLTFLIYIKLNAPNEGVKNDVNSSRASVNVLSIDNTEGPDGIESPTRSGQLPKNSYSSPLHGKPKCPTS